MDSMLFSGVVDLPWWGYVIVALLLTHITIVTVTVFLHRHQAHHALDLHSTGLANGQKTCIDCHKGVAHRLPDMAGVE